MLLRTSFSKLESSDTVAALSLQGLQSLACQSKISCPAGYCEGQLCAVFFLSLDTCGIIALTFLRRYKTIGCRSKLLHLGMMYIY